MHKTEIKPKTLIKLEEICVISFKYFLVTYYATMLIFDLQNIFSYKVIFQMFFDHSKK
jgi:hypothetical protein